MIIEEAEKGKGSDDWSASLGNQMTISDQSEIFLIGKSAPAENHSLLNK